MTAPDEKPRAVSPLPIPRPRGAFYEGGMCVHHDCPTETQAGVERCRKCMSELDDALAVLEGAHRRRRRLRPLWLRHPFLRPPISREATL